MQELKTALEKLQNYIEAEDYKGWDPYDILKSPFFKLPLLKGNKLIRFYSQQFGKRFPLNIRPLLLIPKGCNPVTLGLSIQALSYMSIIDPNDKDSIEEKISILITRLKQLIPPGFNGACWGYDFDWEARHARIPSYKPTIVATGIICNALFENYRITKNIESFNLCKSACDFVIKDLRRTFIGNRLCFSYSPFDELQVLNANMKAVRLLAQVYSISKDETLLRLAQIGTDFVCKHQNADGSWPYSLNTHGQWVDNYHSGYVLDCMHEYLKCTGDKNVIANIEKGYEYYRNNFFEEGYKPKFYNNSMYPIDCSAASQSILTLCRFGDVEKATKTSEFICREMQSKEGFFYFRKFKYYTQKTTFMRWSNAWMFTALAYLMVNGRS